MQQTTLLRSRRSERMSRACLLGSTVLNADCNRRETECCGDLSKRGFALKHPSDQGWLSNLLQFHAFHGSPPRSPRQKTTLIHEARMKREAKNF